MSRGALLAASPVLSWQIHQDSIRLATCCRKSMDRPIKRGGVCTLPVSRFRRFAALYNLGGSGRRRGMTGRRRRRLACLGGPAARLAHVGRVAMLAFLRLGTRSGCRRGGLARLLRCDRHRHQQARVARYLLPPHRVGREGGGGGSADPPPPPPPPKNNAHNTNTQHAACCIQHAHTSRRPSLSLSRAWKTPGTRHRQPGCACEGCGVWGG